MNQLGGGCYSRSSPPPLPFLVRVFRLSVPPVKLFDPTMAEKINFNATIGPEEVGVIVGAWMFGIFTIQV
jgi:hypothetical protein